MTPSVNVLVVEDSLSDAKLLAHELRKGLGSVEIERVEEAQGMRASLGRTRCDLVISDWSLPKFSALEALTVLRETGLDVPFIIVSGSSDEADAVDAMRAGANDYVLKDRLGRLAPAVERELRESKGRRARHGAEEALRKSLVRFARLSESGIVGIVVADVVGNVLEPNDAYLNMLGYSREDFVSGRMGRSWAALTPTEFAEADERAARSLEADGVAPPREKEMIRKDGSRVSVLVGVAMVEYPECIALVADISSRKATEKKLAESQEQFRQAQKMDAIGRLAGGVAHDFNNLLSVILTYSEMGVMDLAPGEPLRADLEEIKGAGERAAELTKQLLAFSRQQVLEPRVLDLNELIAGTSNMLGRLIGEDIELVVLRGPGLGAVLVDPGQIDQVLMNLAVNARDAMPRGGRLTIETSNSELDDENRCPGVLPGRYVVLTVTDTGTGMDDALMSRIFEPFFTTKEKGKGTGLGLSTVFGVIQQSSGHIRIKSAPGHGTTFTIYLPRTDLALMPVEPSVELSTLSGSETILLAEDEDQIRTMIHGLLLRFGYKVIDAVNGDDALVIAEKHVGRIDLLLTDVVMPSMGGADLARRLLPIRPDLKVLCMSGYTEEAVIRYGITEAGPAFLQKPITPEKLARKIREVLAAGSHVPPAPPSGKKEG